MRGLQLEAAPGWGFPGGPTALGPSAVAPWKASWTPRQDFAHSFRSEMEFGLRSLSGLELSLQFCLHRFFESLASLCLWKGEVTVLPVKIECDGLPQRQNPW